MASIFAQDPIYITIQEVKDSTKKTAITLLSDTDIKILIYKAQKSIDNYIVGYWKPFVSWQSFIFPIDIDWVSTIPADIKEACLYCVEQIYENGDTVKNFWNSLNVLKEKTGDHEIIYESSKEESEVVKSWIPEVAETILENYKQSFFNLVA